MASAVSATPMSKNPAVVSLHRKARVNPRRRDNRVFFFPCPYECARFLRVCEEGKSVSICCICLPIPLSPYLSFTLSLLIYGQFHVSATFERSRSSSPHA